MTGGWDSWVLANATPLTARVRHAFEKRHDSRRTATTHAVTHGRTEGDPMSIDVRDNPGEGRYEILVDGAVAGFTTYTLHSDRIALIHTEIAEEYGGRGLGARLVAEELDDLRRRGLQVLPFCPLVRQFIEDHPPYLDLVPATDRARFHLPAAEPEGQE